MHETFTFRFIIKVSLIAIGAALLLLYLLFQARFLISGPQIVLIEEVRGLTNERQVFLTGTAHNIARLWLNDRPIYTDPQGNFKEALVLENGYTVSTLRAEDRYGRTTTIARPFVYIPASFVSN